MMPDSGFVLYLAASGWWMCFVLELPDINNDGIAALALHRQDDVDVASASEGGGNADIRLIQANEASLWSGVGNLGHGAADSGGDVRQRGTVAKAHIGSYLR